MIYKQSRGPYRYYLLIEVQSNKLGGVPDREIVKDSITFLFC